MMKMKCECKHEKTEPVNPLLAELQVMDGEEYTCVCLDCGTRFKNAPLEHVRTGIEEVLEQLEKERQGYR